MLSDLKTLTPREILAGIVCAIVMGAGLWIACALAYALES